MHGMLYNCGAKSGAAVTPGNRGASACLPPATPKTSPSLVHSPDSPLICGTSVRARHRRVLSDSSDSSICSPVKSFNPRSQAAIVTAVPDQYDQAGTHTDQQSSNGYGISKAVESSHKSVADHTDPRWDSASLPISRVLTSAQPVESASVATDPHNQAGTHRDQLPGCVSRISQAMEPERTSIEENSAPGLYSPSLPILGELTPARHVDRASTMATPREDSRRSYGYISSEETSPGPNASFHTATRTPANSMNFTEASVLHSSTSHTFSEVFTSGVDQATYLTAISAANSKVSPSSPISHPKTHTRSEVISTAVDQVMHSTSVRPSTSVSSPDSPPLRLTSARPRHRRVLSDSSDSDVEEISTAHIRSEAIASGSSQVVHNAFLSPKQSTNLQDAGYVQGSSANTRSKVITSGLDRRTYTTISSATRSMNSADNLALRLMSSRTQNHHVLSGPSESGDQQSLTVNTRSDVITSQLHQVFHSAVSSPARSMELQGAELLQSSSSNTRSEAITSRLHATTYVSASSPSKSISSNNIPALQLTSARPRQRRVLLDSNDSYVHHSSAGSSPARHLQLHGTDSPQRSSTDTRSGAIGIESEQVVHTSTVRRVASMISPESPMLHFTSARPRHRRVVSDSSDSEPTSPLNHAPSPHVTSPAIALLSSDSEQYPSSPTRTPWLNAAGTTNTMDRLYNSVRQLGLGSILPHQLPAFQTPITHQGQPTPGPNSQGVIGPSLYDTSNFSCALPRPTPSQPVDEVWLLSDSEPESFDSPVRDRSSIRASQPPAEFDSPYSHGYSGRSIGPKRKTVPKMLTFDERSPRQVSPQRAHKQDDDDPMFTTGPPLPGKNTSSKPPDTDARAFSRRRTKLTRDLYTKWNQDVFGSRLPANLPIVWNSRLLSTAGQCVDDGSRSLEKKDKKSKLATRIELSTKVVDCEARLRQTLAHEMCHAAAWEVDKECKVHHGAAFWRWAARFSAYDPEIKVSRLHNYELFAPYRWQCMSDKCGKHYQRHKNTIDVARHRCGVCGSKLHFVGKFSRATKTTAPQPLNSYSMFVKSNYASTKQQLPPGSTHKSVMKELSSHWSVVKQQKAADQLSTQQQPQQQPQQQQQQQSQLPLQQQPPPTPTPALAPRNLSYEQDFQQAGPHPQRDFPKGVHGQMGSNPFITSTPRSGLSQGPGLPPPTSRNTGIVGSGRNLNEGSGLPTLTPEVIDISGASLDQAPGLPTPISLVASILSPGLSQGSGLPASLLIFTDHFGTGPSPNFGLPENPEAVGSTGTSMVHNQSVAVTYHSLVENQNFELRKNSNPDGNDGPFTYGGASSGNNRSLDCRNVLEPAGVQVGSLTSGECGMDLAFLCTTMLDLERQSTFEDSEQLAQNFKQLTVETTTTGGGSAMGAVDMSSLSAAVDALTLEARCGDGSLRTHSVLFDDRFGERADIHPESVVDFDLSIPMGGLNLGEYQAKKVLSHVLAEDHERQVKGCAVTTKPETSKYLTLAAAQRAEGGVSCLMPPSASTPGPAPAPTKGGASNPSAQFPDPRVHSNTDIKIGSLFQAPSVLDISGGISQADNVAMVQSSVINPMKGVQVGPVSQLLTPTATPSRPIQTESSTKLPTTGRAIRGPRLIQRSKGTEADSSQAGSIAGIAAPATMASEAGSSVGVAAPCAVTSQTGDTVGLSTLSDAFRVQRLIQPSSGTEYKSSQAGSIAEVATSSTSASQAGSSAALSAASVTISQAGSSELVAGSSPAVFQEGAEAFLRFPDHADVSQNFDESVLIQCAKVLSKAMVDSPKRASSNASLQEPCIALESAQKLCTITVSTRATNDSNQRLEVGSPNADSPASSLNSHSMDSPATFISVNLVDDACTHDLLHEFESAHGCDDECNEAMHLEMFEDAVSHHDSCLESSNHDHETSQSHGSAILPVDITWASPQSSVNSWASANDDESPPSAHSIESLSSL